MANYKIVNADQLEADLASVADSIRAKAGTSGTMAFPDGFKSAVEGIQAGGGSGNIPSAETEEFGRAMSDDVSQIPTGKSYYNTVLLPDIPKNVLAQYPYAWIRDFDGYDLIAGQKPWYYGGTMFTEESSYVWYTATVDATEWTYKASYTDNGNFGIANGIVWANHDIPNGSATSTEIYLEGTEAVQQMTTDNECLYGNYVANSEVYAVTNEALNELAHRMQKRYSTYDTFSGAEIRDFIERCDFYENGTPSSTVTWPGAIESSAVGELTE